MKSKTILQSGLTSECWLIQFWGLEACQDCEYVDTQECGGQQIREDLLETGQHGQVNVDGLPDVRGG